MDNLRNFLMGCIFGVERFSGQAVDVVDVIVFDALFEHFGADEARCASEEDDHVVAGYVWCC